MPETTDLSPFRGTRMAGDGGTPDGSRAKVIWLFAVGAALLAGLAARLTGLGRWPLTTDEFYIASSVGNILASGLPAFDCGGLYMRGLLYQYAIVPLRLAGLEPELASRAVSVASNLAAVPAVWLLGRRVGGLQVAAAAVVIFALSLWEIEFARFGRMYAPFQALFLWYLVFMLRTVLDEDTRAQKWLYACSIVGLLLWEGAVLLAALNFLPAVLRQRVTFREALAGGVVLAASVAFVLYDFRVGVADALPPGLPSGPDGTGRLLSLAQTLPANLAWLPLLVVAGVAAAWFAWRVACDTHVMAGARIVLVLIIALGAGSWFGLAVGAFVVLALVGWLPKDQIWIPAVRSTAIACAIFFAAWMLFGLGTQTWRAFIEPFHESLAAAKLLAIFLKMPNVFDRILYPWMDAIPAVTVGFGGMILVGGLVCLSGAQRPGGMALRVLITIGALAALFVGLAPAHYSSTRYTFFIYPLVIVVAASSVAIAVSWFVSSSRWRGIVYAVAILGLFVISEDFSVQHLRAVADEKQNYRIGIPSELAAHFYSRRDYRTPAEYVNRHRGDGDIVMTTLLPATAYLAQTDYLYRNYRNAEFAVQSCAGGTRVRWSDAALVYSEAQMHAAIAAAPSTVWLIAYDANHRALREEGALDVYAREPVYSGVDNRVHVYRIEPGGAPRAQLHD